MTTKEQFCTALFCCEPYVFLVGVMSGKLFLIDTHPVNQDLGGNGRGGLVRCTTTARLKHVKLSAAGYGNG